MKYASDSFVWIINEKKQKMSLKGFKIWGVAIIGILSSPLFTSCNSNNEEELIGNWVELSDFDGIPRSDAVGFSIGSKGYIGTGYDGTERLNDFWEYDPGRNAWTQLADLPGEARNGAIGFGTDSKGYLGTGYDGKNRLDDFYEYDPVANAWMQKASFAGSARYGAVAMVLGNKGYVGTGYDVSYLKDFWEYDPASDMWTQKTSIGGSKRRDAACFTINGKGYIVTGIDNGEYQTDLWEYDPGTDNWAKKRAITNLSTESYDDKYLTIVGIGKVGFSIGNKGYLATGGQTTGSDTWEYDPLTDLWTQKTSFEGSIRADAVGFTLGNRGYVATGRSGSYYFDDIWAFDPDATYDQYD